MQETKEVKVVCGFLQIADGFVLVHELGYDDKLIKCPGGQVQVEMNEKPIDTLIRELGEEIGIKISKEDIKNSHDVEKRDHIMRFFCVTAKYIKFKELKKGSEIEFIKLLPDKKALEMAICFKDIVTCHASAITELLKTV